MKQATEKIKARFKGKTYEEKPDPAKNGPATPPPAEKEKKEKPPKEEKPEAKEEPVAAKESTEELVNAVKESSAATRAALELVARQERKQQPSTPAPPAKSPLEQKLERLPDNVREEVPILQAMEERFPDKYKGIVNRYADAAQKTLRYAEQWEKDHPGEQFDAKSEEHNDFFRNNEVTWDDRDYQRAAARVELQPELEKERKRTDEQLRGAEIKATQGELEPVIRQAQGAIARATLKEVAPNHVDVVLPSGHINEEVYKKLSDEDPLVAKAIVTELGPLAMFVREAEKLFHPSGFFEFDSNNPAHMEIYQVAIEEEKRIKALPLQRQRDGDGRLFATRAEYLELTDREQGDRWIIGKGALIEQRRKAAATKLKESIDMVEKTVEKVAKARGYVKADAPKPGAEAKAEPAKEAAPNNTPPPGPGSIGQTKVDTLKSPSDAQPTDFRSRLKQMMRGSSLNTGRA